MDSPTLDFYSYVLSVFTMLFGGIVFILWWFIRYPIIVQENEEKFKLEHKIKGST